MSEAALAWSAWLKNPGTSRQAPEEKLWRSRLSADRSE
jgi:hypothetical protein